MNKYLLYHSASYKYYIVDMVVGGTTKYTILKFLTGIVSG